MNDNSQGLAIGMSGVYLNEFGWVTIWFLNWILFIIIVGNIILSQTRCIARQQTLCRGFRSCVSILSGPAISLFWWRHRIWNFWRSLVLHEHGRPMVVLEVGTTWSHPSLLTHASDFARPWWPSAVGTLERRSPAFAELGFFLLLLPSVNSNHVHSAYTASTIVDSLVAAFRPGATPKSQHLGYQSTTDLMSGV